jgi:NAD(P)-binding Rossmann-like domain
MWSARAVVVGGGTEGLSGAALALRAAGAEVKMYERSRANGMRMDSGQPINIGQPVVQDYDVGTEARAMRWGLPGVRPGSRSPTPSNGRRTHLAYEP